jgi:hypothetical protein
LFVSITSSKTGLFSATVAAFIIEFYKKLSPDSGNQTVALLGQISQQLSNFPNGTFPITAIQPSPPSASMIWVNAMWLISLVLSLASALIATLLQEWARRFVEMPNVSSEPNHRARVRSFLFLGTEFYKMRLIAQMAFSLLHLSIYLFFGGLVIAFHTINKKVAIAVDVAVGLFGLAYIALSILPCLDVRCPYRTPMSYILWYPWHTLFYFAAILLRQFGIQSLEDQEGWFYSSLYNIMARFAPNFQQFVQRTLRRTYAGMVISGENTFKAHWRYIKDGLGKSIINSAINTQERGTAI